MRNEGATSVFISCAAQFGYNASGVADAVLIATNTNAQPVDLTCTLVDGVLSIVFYYPKTISIPANDAAQIVWLPSDNGGTSFTGFENFSCNVPSGVEINVVGFDYESTSP
jgi:frataxin-like iron-binding protein CyaY